MLGMVDTHHILGSQRLKVEAVGRIEVRRYCLRIVVYRHDIVAELLERPDALHRGIVKLDALTDADGTGPEDDDRPSGRLLSCLFPLTDELSGLVLRIVAGIEIRRLRIELTGTGVDHLVGRIHMGKPAL